MVLALCGPARAEHEPALLPPIDRLIEQLGDDSFEVRNEADQRLQAMGIAALPAVYQATANDDPEVRRRAWHLIDAWAAGGAIPALLIQLEQAQSPEFRLQALDALGRLGPRALEAVPTLTRVLNDPCEVVRHMARDTLGKIQPMPAVRVEISDAANPLEVGDETIYDIQVTNDGTAAATDLRLLAHMPRQMTVTQIQAPANNDMQGRRIAFEPVCLDPQTSIRYRLHVKAITSGSARLRVELTMNEAPGPIQAQGNTTIAARPAGH
jgi:uncharacterized repeat protein (TIGR01451 family)